MPEIWFNPESKLVASFKMWLGGCIKLCSAGFLNVLSCRIWKLTRCCFHWKLHNRRQALLWIAESCKHQSYFVAKILRVNFVNFMENIPNDAFTSNRRVRNFVVPQKILRVWTQSLRSMQVPITWYTLVQHRHRKVLPNDLVSASSTKLFRRFNANTYAIAKFVLLVNKDL